MSVGFGCCIVYFHREHSSFALYKRSFQSRANVGCIDCGRHYHNLQVGAYYLLSLSGEGKSKVGINAALMKLVEYHHAHSLECGVVHEHSCEDTLRQHFNPRLLRYFVLKSNPVAHSLSHLFAKHLRHALGYLSCGESARFKHEDFSTFVIQSCQYG